MTNGFYDMDGMTTRQLKRFYKEAVLYGYEAHLEHCPSWTREKFTGSSIAEIIEEQCSKKTHNVCIDRSLYSSGGPGQDYGEVGFSSLKEIEGKPSFLYIFMTLENLNALVKRFDLKLKEWPR